MVTKCNPEFVADVMSGAQRLLIDHPVVFLLRGPSSKAQRVASALENSGIPAIKLCAVPVTGTQFVLVGMADACRLLRQYAGPGGSYIATKVETSNGDFHTVALMENMVAMAPVLDGAEIAHCGTPYERVEPWQDAA